MDLSYNLNQSVNGSMDASSGLGASGVPGVLPGNFPGMQDLQNLTPQQLYHLQQINQQQIQQLTAQMARMQPMDNAGHSLAQSSPVTPTVSPFTMPQPYPQMVSPTYSPMSPPPQRVVMPTVSMNASFNGTFPGLPESNANTFPVQSQVAYPNSPTRITEQSQLQRESMTMPHTQGLERSAAVPNTLSLQQTHAVQAGNLTNNNLASSATSTPRDSPVIPKEPTRPPPSDVASNEPTFMARPRQQISSPLYTGPPPPMSDKSSNSSASIPSSPVSTGNTSASFDRSWSEESGPKTPEVTKKIVNGEVRSPTIQNKPLQMKTRYPQDKCYACMKKVYPMEKLGAVRGVVYHKGCFRCKVCQTQLTLKNFFHSQGDTYDLSVYCKSHQPLVTDQQPKLDSESFEIKSALQAPKKSTVTPESSRTPVHSYNYDTKAQEIEHARKAPVSDLQRGTKLRANAWSKSKREKEPMPPSDVVRHDEPVPEYNAEEYTRHRVETSPDYR